jgi:hypothetical protein
MPDAYSTCVEHMNTELGYSFEVTREDSKQALMCYFYGSEAEPKNIFGEGTPAYSAFFVAAKATAPEAYSLRTILIEAWQPFTLKHSWVMPDNFHVNIKVMGTHDEVIKVPELNSSFTHRFMVNQGSKTGLSLAANCIHATDGLIVREMNRRCNYSVNELTNALRLLKADQRTRLLPNQIDKTKFLSLNAIEDLCIDTIGLMHINTVTRLENLIHAVMRESKPFELVTIHDAFRCLANNMNTVRYWYKEILAELADSHIMQDILRQIYNDNTITLDRASETLGDLIRNSNYGIA